MQHRAHLLAPRAHRLRRAGDERHVGLDERSITLVVLLPPFKVSAPEMVFTEPARKVRRELAVLSVRLTVVNASLNSTPAALALVTTIVLKS